MCRHTDAHAQKNTYTHTRAGNGESAGTRRQKGARKTGKFSRNRTATTIAATAAAAGRY